MSNQYPADKYAEYEHFDQNDNSTPIRFVSQIKGAEVKKYTGVLVECWDHKNYGRGKRGYLATFSESERNALTRLYKKAYGWEMRTGHPDYIQMKMSTFELLQRAADFFATL